MSFSDFTSLYGTTQKAKFWCDYMTGLRGQLQALPLDPSKTRGSSSVWSRVATSEVLLYDVLYGEYFPAVGKCWPCSLHWATRTSVLIITSREKSSHYKLLPGWVWPGSSRDTAALLSGPQQDIREDDLQNIQNILEWRTNVALLLHIYVLNTTRIKIIHKNVIFFYIKQIGTAPSRMSWLYIK